MIKLIVLGVDGTLTDGKIIYDDKGGEYKAFCVKDGLGIAAWIRLGRSVAIITGRDSSIVEKRAKELKVQHLRQGVADKAAALREIVESQGLDFSEVAVIGDDLNDLPMINLAKYSFAPKNAVKEVKKSVKKVLKSRGGDGAVREMIEKILKKDKLQDKFYALFV